MAGLKNFLPTEGTNAGRLFDTDGNEILITNESDREAIAGARVPVDIGTRPNANDGDPLRTSFSKLNNFVLASYQNDSDIQERVEALEAGAIFLGVYRADQLPRRELPNRTPRPWTAADRWPDSTGVIYDEKSSEAVPNLEENPDATDVYAMISRPISGRPDLSICIGNIREHSTPGQITIRLFFPTAITPTLTLPTRRSDSETTGAIIVRDTDGDITSFPFIQTQVSIGSAGTSTAEEIANEIVEQLQMQEDTLASGTSNDYFSFEIDAPDEDTRSITIHYNFKAATATTTRIPSELITIIGAAGDNDAGAYTRTLPLISVGTTASTGTDALPWIDQDLPSQDTIPAYTIFEWTRDGWSIADQGRGDINAEFLFFDDERRDVTIERDNTDATGRPNDKEIEAEGTRDAITEVQQFGIDYVHNVTLDGGTY